jgi:hypothetical protein
MIKKLLISLVASAMLLSSVFAPAANAAFLTTDEMRATTSQVGLPVDGVEFELLPDEDLNASFQPGGMYCMFFGELCATIPTTIAFWGDWSGAPLEVRLLVLLHELGHYAQYLEKRAFDEWDADVYAVNKACELGLDGPYWADQVARYIVSHYDIPWGANEDGVHGSWVGRVENAKAKAKVCGDRFQQAGG